MNVLRMQFFISNYRLITVICLPLLLCSSFSQITSNEIEGEVVQEKIHFYVTPLVERKSLEKNLQKLTDFLSRESGIQVNGIIPANMADLVDDFGKDASAVAILNPQSYLLANKKHGATAKMRVMRYGKSTYQGQIIVHANSGIKSIAQLQGKSIGYTDSTSTSGYLFPARLIKNANVKPSKVMFCGNHNEVVRKVYLRQIDAGATFYSEPSSDGTIHDARSLLEKTYSDVTEKVQIIAITDPIPNDALTFSKSTNKDLTYKISIALLKFSNTEDGKETLRALCGAEGFVRCSDADYDVFRQVTGIK